MGRIKEANRSNRPVRHRKPVVYIICEGQETEIRYFKRFKTRDCIVEISPKISQHKEALSLVQHAKDVLKQDVFFPDTGDTVWCVFDRDDNSNARLREASQLASRLSYKIAFSNPSIELWILLHFKDQRASLPDADSVINILTKENLIPLYKKSSDIYDTLIDMQSLAIQRAQDRLDQLIKDGITLVSRDSNPASNIHHLVTYLNSKRGHL